MTPEKTNLGSLNFIGLEIRTTNQAEANPATTRIPAVWQRFFAEGITGQIPALQEPQLVYGVYTSYESDQTGPYSMLVAHQTASLAEVPAGLVGVQTKPASYLVFPAHGPMPQALVATWASVWQFFAQPGPYERAYTTDFELHRDAGRTVEIYIALK